MLPNTMVTGSSASSGASGSAQEALEALAGGSTSRVRYSSTSGRIAQSSRSRERDRRERNASRDREDDRIHSSESPSIAGGAFESPELGAYPQSRLQANNSSFWGIESLPPNATSNYSASVSAFSTFAPGSNFTDNSHFFPSGPGVGGFSFEGEGVSSAGSAGPAFQFRDRMPFDSLPENSSWGSYAADNIARARRATGAGPTSLRPVRRLHYRISGSSSGERGLVALAKPREAGEEKVAVAGKSFLKLLRVPPAPHSSNVSSGTTTTQASSIASRRSRSRGSPGPFGRSGGSGGSTESSLDRSSPTEGVSEILDLRSGSRLSPTYLFTDVDWGYGDSANKLATSFSNGAVAIWDLQKEGPNRIEQVMQQHDRSVNRVIFGGPSGNYVLSGGQDGQIKIWDSRMGRLTNNILKTSSPIQRLKFSPSPSQPWTLLAVCTSGTLIRFDLRNLGTKPSSSMTDRIAGHVGPCLAMDWRDNFDSDGDRREGGWVVTAGMDKTIKIWDFSQPTLSTRPARTLLSSQAIQDVAWHPTRGTELASSPLLALSSTALSSESSSGTAAAFWKNEVEIWDTRRPNFPRAAIKTEDAASAVLYNDNDTVWCASKTKSTFEQYDIRYDSYDLLESFPRPGAVSSVDGDILFASATSSSDLWDKSMNEEVDAVPPAPDSSISMVSRIDPDFSQHTFAHLANSLAVGGDDFGAVCDQNAEAYDSIDRRDASQLWTALKIWFDERPTILPDSPPATPPLMEPSLQPTTSQSLQDWLMSPTATVDTVATSHPAPSRYPGRRSFSKPISRGRSVQNSPIMMPTDIHSNPPFLDAFSEESTASERDSKVPDAGDSTDTSETDNSEHERTARLIALAATTGAGPPHKIVASLAAHQPSRARSSTVTGFSSFATLSGDGPPGSSADPLPDDDSFSLAPSRASSSSRKWSRRHSLSSGSDSDGDDGHAARTRAAKVMGRGSAPSLRSQRVTFGAGPVPNMSRRGSTAPSGGIEALAKLTVAPVPERPTEAQLSHETSLARVKDALEVVKTQLRATLQDYANQGDAQLCATLCCVLQHKSIGLPASFVARVTKAYLDLLRRCQLHVAAAAIIKGCSVDSIRSLSLNTVVFHVACGRCGKSCENMPHGFCFKCEQQVSRCCICHLAVRSLLVMCTTCGHGAHVDCLEGYTATLSNRLAGMERYSPHDVSHPSTPGLPTAVIRAWLWDEVDDGIPATKSVTDVQEALQYCPSGSCSHHPCLLTAGA